MDWWTSGRQVLDCASPLAEPYTHSCNSARMANRTRSSPSPQPSPLGRGSVLAHGFGDCEGLGSSNDGKWFSLSPRERVGVRGNGIDARQRTSRRQLDLSTENVENRKLR